MRDARPLHTAAIAICSGPQASSDRRYDFGKIELGANHLEYRVARLQR
jgi:hypothetical protein